MYRKKQVSLRSRLLSAWFGVLTISLTQVVLGQPGGGPAPVVVSPVLEQEVLATQIFVGSVTPSQRVIVGSAVDGRVVACDIEEGDRVDEGQPLAQLLTETISLEIKTAESQLLLKKSQLEELVNGTRTEVMEQARARMAATKAREEYQINRRERLRAISENSNAVTEDEWNEAVAAALEAQEAAAEAKAAYDEAKAGPRPEDIAQARAEVAMQQAVVERLIDQKAKHTIRSRFPGYVVAKHTEAGAWVNRGGEVAEVVGVDVVEVVVQVLERSIPYVTIGAEVDVEIPALPQSPFKGTVIAIVPQGDMQARTFPVKIAIQNQTVSSGPLIKPGMFAQVELPVGSKTKSLLVPKDSVVLSQRGSIVYVVNGKGDGVHGVEPRPVSLGRVFGSLIEVKGQLTADQLVVSEGNERLNPKSQVSIIRTDNPSMVGS